MLNLLKTGHFVRFFISRTFSISNKSPGPLKVRDGESRLYGLSPASAIFQRCLEQTLGGIKGFKCISDDVIIYSKTIEEHHETLRKLFDRIRDSGLTLNYEKCLFLQIELKFFGVILSSAGVKPDPEKTAVLREALPLSNIS